MKTYTIIGGVNGVGKSSFTGVKKESMDLGVIIDVDQITADLGKGMIAGARVAVKQIHECLEKGVSFTQESTLSGVSIESNVKKAKELGYYIRLYYVALDTAEDSIIRIQNRVMKKGHYIPSEDVLRRFSARWEALAKVLPYCDEAEFYDNDNGFQKVADYRERLFSVDEVAQPIWLTEMTEYLREHTEIPFKKPGIDDQLTNAEAKQKKRSKDSLNHNIGKER